METYSYCPDEESLDLDGSNDLASFFDPEFFELSADGKGWAFKNHFGYIRPMVPVLYSNATPITMGASTMDADFTRVRVTTPSVAYGTGDPLDVYICAFRILLTLGAGFVVPAGTLHWTGSVLGTIGNRLAPNDSNTGIFGTAIIRDASPATVYKRNLYIQANNGRIVMGNYGANAPVANNSPIATLAVGDSFAVSGVCFDSVLRSDPLT